MRYAAFLSYHHDEDHPLALALERALGRIAVPWYRLTGRRVFRDESELAADPSLWGSIKEALDQSEYLVLLLSPGAARSPWVDREVRYWLETRSLDRLIIAITRWEDDHGDSRLFNAPDSYGGGRWGSSLRGFQWTGDDVPPALRGTYPDEPRPVDARWARDYYNPSLKDPRFREMVAEIAAPILGRSKAELVGEEVRQRRRFRRVGTGVGAVMALAMVVAAVSFREAIDRGKIAASNRLAAQSREVLELRHDLALLLSVEASVVRPTAEAHAALLAALANRADVVRYLHAGDADLTAVAVSPDGAAVAAGTARGRVIIWEAGKRWAPRELMSRWGATVTGLAFAPGGERLVIATGSPAEITLLDPWSNQEMWRARGLVPGSIGSREMTLDKGGTLLAVAGADGTIAVLSAATGEALSGPSAETSKGEGSPPSEPAREGADPRDASATAADPGGRAAGSLEGAGTREPPASGATESGKWSPVPGSTDEPDTAAATRRGMSRALHPGGVTSLALHPEGRLLASGGWDEVVRIWDVESGVEVGRLLPTGRVADNPQEAGPSAWSSPADRRPVLALSFSPEGALLQSYTAGGLVVLWDVDSGRRLGEAQGPAGPAFLGMAPDGRTFVLEEGRALVVWDARADEVRRLDWLHEWRVAGVGFAGLAGTMATIGGGHAVFMDVRSPRTLGRRIAGPLEIRPASGVCLSPDASLLAYADGDGAIHVRTAAGDTRVLGPLEGHEQIATDIAFAPDGSALASVADDGLLIVWDLTSGTVRFRTDAHPYGTTAVTYSPDGTTLVAAGAMHSGPSVNPSTGEAFEPAEAQWQLIELDAASGRRRGEPWPLPGEAPVWDLAFSPDGAMLAVASGDATTVWDPRTRQPVGEPVAQVGLTKSLAFGAHHRLASAAGGSIAVRTVGRSARLRADAQTEVEAPFTGVLQTVALGPEGRMMAFAGDAGDVILWDLEAGVELGPLVTGPGQSWDALTFGPRGRSLVAAGAGGVVLWDLDPNSWIRAACRLANRSLTREEWGQYLTEVGAYWPRC